MSEHDVPAERGGGELRERLATTLAALVSLRDVVRDSGKLNGMEYDELGVQVNRAIEKAEAALLAPQGAPQTHEVAAESPSRGPDGSEVGSGLRRDCRAIAAPHEAPPILSRKHANEIAYFLRRPDMAHDAKRERLASLVERVGAAHQERDADASCVWTCDEDGNWDTTCGGMFILIADTPKQNGMNYCCYCGRTLTEADEAYRLDMAAQAGGGDAPE